MIAWFCVSVLAEFFCYGHVLSRLDVTRAYLVMTVLMMATVAVFDMVLLDEAKSLSTSANTPCCVWPAG